MKSTEEEPEVQTFSLVETLDRDWLKIPLDAMRRSGAASQTLAGILKFTFREAYWSIANIAKSAKLPEGTVKRHLVRLADDGWIEQKGRERTRGGNLRRTATIAVTKQTKDRLREGGYAFLPWWACLYKTKLIRRRYGRQESVRREMFDWATKAVLAVFMSRLLKLKSTIEAHDGCGLNAELFEDSVANMGDESNFKFILSTLMAATGLSKPSVVKAKKELHRSGIITWTASKADNGRDGPDILIPRYDFQIEVKNLPNGMCNVRLIPGVKK